MQLETNRLILRPWRQSDIGDLIEGLNDFAVSRWLAFVPHPFTENDAQKWIDFCLIATQKDKEPSSYEFAIEIKQDRKAIGGVSLTRISRQHGTAGGGIWLNSKYKGHGFGSEAFGEKIRFAFEELNLRRLENGFFEGNEASFAMQARFGYKLEGQKRSAFRCMADGELRDECITGLMREDWIKDNAG